MSSFKIQKGKSDLLFKLYSKNSSLLNAWAKSVKSPSRIQNGIMFKLPLSKYKSYDDLMDSEKSPLPKIIELSNEVDPIEGGEEAIANEIQNQNVFIASVNQEKHKFRTYLKDFMEYLMHTKDLDRNELTQMIIGSQNEKKTQYGIIYGGTNRMFIKFQKPDATFVTTKEAWYRYYNRGVLPNAQPIYVITGKNSVIDQDKVTAKFGDGELTANQKNGMRKRLGAVKTTDHTAIGSAIVYDISDTQVIGKHKDVFNTEPGLLSNITGELNPLAKKENKKNRIDNSDNDYDENQYREKTFKLIKSDVALSNMNYFLKEKGYQATQDLNQALDNLIDFEVSRHTDTSDVNGTKYVAKEFILYFFRKIFTPNLKNSSKPKTENIHFSTRQDYLNTFYMIRQASDVILGRNFGIKQIGESVEEVEPRPIEGNLPTIKDFLNFMDVDLSSFSQNTIKTKQEPTENTTSEDEENSSIKESFMKLYNKIKL